MNYFNIENMKSSKIKIFFFTLLVVPLQSCEKKTIELYQNEAGVYWTPNSESFYTFTEHLDKIDEGCDYVNVPVLITGLATDADREFDVVFMKDDTLHTAENGMIELSRGLVRANEYGGHVRVKINYSKELDDSIYVARVQILPSAEFPVVDLNGRNYSIRIGNIFGEPENWRKIRFFFGNVYSNSWYKWVLQTLNRSSIPYKYYAGKDEEGITPEEAERWPMKYEEVEALSAKIKVELNKYNNANPGNEMRHEDGVKKGELVVM